MQSSVSPVVGKLNCRRNTTHTVVQRATNGWNQSVATRRASIVLHARSIPSEMECWSPKDYERIIEDTKKISSAPAGAKSSNPGAGASEEQAQGKE